MASTISARRPPGRPRGFDEVTALENAMRVFWARGYDQAPVEALCQAMNMPRSSLYHVFGDKQGLFLSALGHYTDTRLRPVIDALGPARGLRDDLRAFFDQVVHLASADAETPGCLISSVLADAAVAHAALQAERDRWFEALEARIETRLAADGWPETGPYPAGVAASLGAAMARGIVLRARSGQGADLLRPVAAAAADALAALRGHAGNGAAAPDRTS